MPYKSVFVLTNIYTGLSEKIEPTIANNVLLLELTHRAQSKTNDIYKI